MKISASDRAADTRGRAELEAQLGREYGGVLSSDERSVYNGYAVVAGAKMLGSSTPPFSEIDKNSRTT